MAGALVRDLDEELGIRIETPDQPPWETVQADGVELNVFLVYRWNGEPKNAATDEHDDMRWVGPAELEILADRDRVVARVLVEQDGLRFWCSGLYRIRHARIADADEYWVTEGADAPPGWRSTFAQQWAT